jgi:hypothetical protein
LPIVHSTVNVKTSLDKPPISQLQDVLGDHPIYDRNSINAWEDVDSTRRWGRRAARMGQKHSHSIVLGDLRGSI